MATSSRTITCSKGRRDHRSSCKTRLPMTPSTSAGRLATISPCCGSIRRPATQQVAIGDSETLRVDQTIYAIGNPFRLSYTLSTGIVSALGRRIENVDGTPTEDVIQIDATINQENSGGGGGAARQCRARRGGQHRDCESHGRFIQHRVRRTNRHGSSRRAAVDRDRRVPAPGTWDRNAGPLERGLVRRLGTHGVVVLRVKPGSGAATAGLRPAQVRGNTIIPGDVV